MAMRSPLMSIGLKQQNKKNKKKFESRETESSTVFTRLLKFVQLLYYIILSISYYIKQIQLRVMR